MPGVFDRWRMSDVRAEHSVIGRLRLLGQGVDRDAIEHRISPMVKNKVPLDQRIEGV